MKNGIIYVATKQAEAVEGAFLSAESVKQHTPDIHITLYTDQPTNPLCAMDHFDAVEDISGADQAFSEDRLGHITQLAQSPYEQTLYLGNDTRVLTRAIPDLFTCLNEFDFGVVKAAPEINRNSERRTVSDGVLLYGRINKEKLISALNPEESSAGLRLKTLDSSWNYSGNKPDATTNIVRSNAFIVSTKPDLLNVARAWSTAGREDEAQHLYDYVGTFPPLRQLRAYWPLAVTPKASGKIGEEWESPRLKQADLHINYRQHKLAADILGGITEEKYKPQILTGRARLALASGAAPDAQTLIEQAVALAPDSPYAAIIQGAVYVGAGRFKDAIAPLTQAAGAGRGGAFFFLGIAWLNLENYEEAAESNRKAMSFDNKDLAPANSLFLALLSARKYRETVDHANTMLERQAGHTTSLASKAIALSELDEQRELAELLGQDQFVAIEPLKVPDPFQDLEAFNKALAREIAADPTLAYERNTTRLGHQTGDTSQTTTPATRALNEQVMAVAKRRALAEKDLSDHPFHRSAPEKFTIFSWGVIIGEQGHQAPHYHAYGWLSGVYYIEVPDDILEDDPDRHGWLEFGHGDERWHGKDAVMPTRQIRPQTGLLVTFPSFYWHRTRPLRSDKRRISFAFDIIPI